MEQNRRGAAAAEALFASYEQLTRALLKDLGGLCLLDAALGCLGCSPQLQPGALAERLRRLDWCGAARTARTSVVLRAGARSFLCAVPLEGADRQLLGALCLELPAPA
ncbi:MAG TPA: hypothetical protein VL994_12185, partial [Steroidobacteraceae bacterium]|nr:hypothetical protein [Steroidobacteraceae bacterium]